ncbi:MAG TPA: 6-phosphogluconolactonase [Acidimicrobiales bacterium]
MRHELRDYANADAVAAAAANYVARFSRQAIDDHGHFTFAVSGGRTPWSMFEKLAKMDVAWDDVVIYQVDERIAPVGDATRNLTNLENSLGDRRPTVVAMPVNDDDLDEAAASYAQTLPPHFDLVHLGLGPDGHTASLIPGDPVLDVRDRLVAVTGVYQGEQRMTLTYEALARAQQLLWLITGEDKRSALAALLSGDTSIPAGCVVAPSSLVMADEAALS